MQVFNKEGAKGSITQFNLESGRVITIPHGLSEVSDDIGRELIKTGRVEAVTDKTDISKTKNKGEK